MTESKKTGKTIFELISRSFKIYFDNFPKLTRVMLFPVFGQVLGMILIFVVNYFYTQKYLVKIADGTLNHNILLAIIGMFVLMVPGFILFVKAFWEYLVAMVSLNKMVWNIEKTETFEHFKLYNKEIADRKKDYIILLLLLTVIWLFIVLIFPVLSFMAGLFVHISPELIKQLGENPSPELIAQNSGIIISYILANLAVFIISTVIIIFLSVKISLAFQVFAFENIKPLDVIKKSWNLLRGNFWRTVFLGFVLMFFTATVVPLIFNIVIITSGLINYLVMPFDAYISILLGGEEFGNIMQQAQLSRVELAAQTVFASIDGIITSLMLPLGSAAFTLLYFDILERKNADV